MRFTRAIRSRWMGVKECCGWRLKALLRIDLAASQG